MLGPGITDIPMAATVAQDAFLVMREWPMSGRVIVASLTSRTIR